MGEIAFLARPKLQHYVTRAYLEGCLAEKEKLLYCYGRGLGPFRRQPDQLAAQRNYYAIQNPDGTWDDSLEHAIGQSVESPGLPVLKKLTSGNTRLSWEERSKLATLIAFQEARTPTTRARVRENMSALQSRMLTEIWSANPNQTTIDLVGKDGKSATVALEEMIASHNKLMNDDHCSEIHRLMMGHALKLAAIFERMRFTVYYATDAEFLTTDAPVIRVFSSTVPLGYGTQRPDIEVRFPLSRRAFLVLTHNLKFNEKIRKADERTRQRLLAATPEVQVRQASKAQVLTFNRGHVRHAHRWIFAPTEVCWAKELLALPSVSPRMVDLSTRDLLHFQSAVDYDPRIDQP